MTTDLLYRVEDIAEAIAGVIDAQLPDRVTAYPDTLDPSAAAPYLLVTLSSPRWTGPMMAGDQQCTVTLHLLSVGADLGEARMVLDLAREVLIGRARDGSFSTPLPLEGRQIPHRRSNNDGAQDVVTGVPQASESFTLVLQRAEP